MIQEWEEGGPDGEPRWENIHTRGVKGEPNPPKDHLHGYKQEHPCRNDVKGTSKVVFPDSRLPHKRRIST